MDTLKLAQKVLDKAQLDLVMDNKATFFKSVLFSLDIILDEEEDTAFITPSHLVIGARRLVEDIVKDDGTVMPMWTLPQLMGVFMHEVRHFVYDHFTRGSTFDPEIWYYAQETFINLEVLEDGYELPPTRWKDPQFKGMSDVQVYEAMMENPDKYRKPDWKSDVRKGSNHCKKPIPEHLIQQHIQQALVQAHVEANMKGAAHSIPGSIKVKLEKLLNPTVPWQQVLSSYCFAKVSQGYGWQVPDRRALVHDMVLPGIDGEGLRKIGFFPDSSCSVSDDEFRQCASEMEEIISNLMPEETHVAAFDDDLRPVEILHPGDSIHDVNFTGRGGTNINPVLDYIQAQDFDISVIFTDGYIGDYVPKGFSKDVIWVIVNNPGWRHEIGRVVYIETKDNSDGC